MVGTGGGESSLRFRGLGMVNKVPLTFFGGVTLIKGFIFNLVQFFDNLDRSVAN